MQRLPLQHKCTVHTHRDQEQQHQANDDMYQIGTRCDSQTDLSKTAHPLPQMGCAFLSLRCNGERVSWFVLLGAVHAYRV